MTLLYTCFWIYKDYLSDINDDKFEFLIISKKNNKIYHIIINISYSQSK